MPKRISPVLVLVTMISKPFVDDILLTLSNPMYSIPQAQKLVDTFGQFSGYKIIYSKSEAIPLNHLTYQTNLGTSPFKVTPQGMKYLGIKI